MSLFDEMLNALEGLLKIESVTGTNVTEAAPFGEGPTAALHYMLDLCGDLGFRVKNCDDRIGWAEIGEGEEMVGVLCHLDVVPAGEGWDYPAFGMTVTDGRVYGRGTTDDKGPAMCCVYAMKAILDAGVPLRRRIRIIFGLSEEGGDWEDMKYYVAHEELPTFGITPDADFPAIYGEKGILNYALRMKLADSGLCRAAAGEATNVVPAACTLAWTDAGGTEREVTAEGKAAHASTPQLGVNAISEAVDKLLSQGADSRFAAFYKAHIDRDIYGEKMGCGFSDKESGRLTLNAGILRVEGDDLVLELDIRCPVTVSDEKVSAAIRAAAEPFGIHAGQTLFKPPVFADEHGPVITALMEVYREVTGDTEHKASVIGGGTYARAMKNIVAFGPMLPGREMTEHMKNEYALLEDLERNLEIYRRALKRLATESFA